MKFSHDMQYQLVKKESMYAGYFQLNRYSYQIELYQGGWSPVFQREVFERGHAAAALLIDQANEKVVLVEQFRPGAVGFNQNPWLIELVAGIIETDETPEEVIRRESVEEAGCEVKRLKPLYQYLVTPGGSTESVCLFLAEVDATNLVEVAGLEFENENIRVLSYSIAEALALLESGQVNNGMTLIALQWLQFNWNKKADLFAV
ncbi:NUDIX domain-containing protein [Aliikangiella sp. IMCC44632]